MKSFISNIEKKSRKKQNNESQEIIAGTDEKSVWQRKLEKLSHQTKEARQGLVDQEARRRAFRHLDEQFERSPEKYPEILDRVTESYLEGGFFLRNMSLFYEVSPALSLMIYNLRQEWIRQYDLKTVPELLLLDQAMLAYFHTVRLNKQVADMLALTETELFYPDSPAIKIKLNNNLGNEFDGFVAEDAIQKLQERLMPLIERFNQMFIRNLRALRELKANFININVNQVGQINFAHHQVNVKRK